MPKAAIDTGVVDAVLTPELLAEGIDKVILDREYYKKHYEIKNSISQIFSLLNKKTGVDFNDYKESTMLRRIIKRMSEAKVEGTEKYLELLDSTPDEAEILKNELLIIVTSFFRDKDSFSELSRHIKELVANKLDNNIRIWIPACATGQEAYSVAIAVLEVLEQLDTDKKVSIFATDISDSSIQQARKSIYSLEMLENMNEQYIDKYFDRENINTYRPKKEIRELIIFSKHDIIKDPPFINIDLISCRNLLIYFNSDLQKRILHIFYYSLRYYSLLFLGHSETVGNLPLFKVVSNKHKVYKKTNDLADIDFKSISYFAKNNAYRRSLTKKGQEQESLQDIELSISRSIFDALYESGIVVDGASNSILYYKGDTSDYINQPVGLHTNDIFRLLKDYLVLDFRAIFSEAKNKRAFLQSKRIMAFPVSEGKTYITISIFPLQANKLGDDTFFVKFDQEIEQQDFIDDEIFDPIDHNSVNILEDELVYLKERLQITIEELETSNEELQSSNEELQSTNEEMQSTNEELETANEELQSTNEELQTVNDELISKNIELEFSHKAFNNVLTTLKSHILIVDENLNIIKHTEGISQFLEINALSEINLSSLVINSNVNLPNILEDLKYCLKNDREVGYELAVKDRMYWFNIKKIILPNGLNDSDIAMILSFTDKTDIYEKDRLMSQHLKMASMREMIGNISHQWRQPLNALSLSKDYLEIMYKKDQLNDDVMNDFIDKSNALISYMSKTIDDFRNFFAPSKDRVYFDVIDAINEAVLISSEKLKSHGIQIDMPANEKFKTYGYLNEFKQVVINIVNNASDKIIHRSLKNGLISIKVSQLRSDIMIDIRDNAGGIDEDIISKIFDPYFTTKFKSQGTGLGLYMAKIIIEKNMQGSLLAFNKDDGACFTIRIPASE